MNCNSIVSLPEAVYTQGGRSAKKCANLLVETEFFCHFRGINLCNTKHLQLRLIKKKNMGEQFRKSSIPLCWPFF